MAPPRRRPRLPSIAHRPRLRTTAASLIRNATTSTYPLTVGCTRAPTSAPSSLRRTRPTVAPSRRRCSSLGTARRTTRGMEGRGAPSRPPTCSTPPRSRCSHGYRCEPMLLSRLPPCGTKAGRYHHVSERETCACTHSLSHHSPCAQVNLLLSALFLTLLVLFHEPHPDHFVLVEGWDWRVALAVYPILNLMIFQVLHPPSQAHSAVPGTPGTLEHLPNPTLSRQVPDLLPSMMLALSIEMLTQQPVVQKVRRRHSTAEQREANVGAHTCIPLALLGRCSRR